MPRAPRANPDEKDNAAKPIAFLGPILSISVPNNALLNPKALKIKDIGIEASLKDQSAAA